MDLRTGRRGSAVALALMGAAFACATPSRASAQPAEPRASVSVLAGLARPNDATFRELYASGIVPLNAQVDFRPDSVGVEVFGGFRYVEQTGEAQSNTGTPSGLALSFRMASVRFGVGWRAPGRHWQIAVSGGGSYNWYRESWKELDIETEDQALGFVVQTTVSYRISRRLSLLARGEFSAISADSAVPTLGSVSLGSLDVLGGLSLGLWN